jgi:hypothetical protein
LKKSEQILPFLHSTMITSNRPIEKWAKPLSDVPAASAILDRLLHHAVSAEPPLG